jgi:hypothetical protein
MVRGGAFIGRTLIKCGAENGSDGIQGVGFHAELSRFFHREVSHL